MSDADTGSDDSKDSNTVGVPQFLVVNNVHMLNGDHHHVNMYEETVDDEAKPYIEIVEQPQSRGFRFRYECEGPSHGGLQGEKSEKYRKTFPAIKIRNYNGPSRVVVNLVTDEPVPRPHAHKLVGKNCNDGVCTVDVKTGQNTVTFANLCVQHVTRKKSAEVIEQRIIESMKMDKMVKLGNLNEQAYLSEDELAQAKQQAEKQAKDMQLNVVKLCFQAYLKDGSNLISKVLPSVLSSPIYDSKAPGANVLKICRMDKYGGSCRGDEEVFLLCEKVQKDDISVRFVEQDEDGNVVWEAFGNFGPFDVHRQYAIVFKTPAYKDPTIDRTVNVFIMLQRKSDGETSDPKSFTYYPQKDEIDELLKHKRSKKMPSYPGPGNFGGPGGNNSSRNNINITGIQTNNPFSQQSQGGNLPITVNQDTMDTTPVSNAQQQQQLQQAIRMTATPNRRPRQRQQTASANDLTTDGESQLPTLFSQDIYMQPQGPPMMQMPQQDMKQNVYQDPNLMYFQQFAVGNQHIPFQQLQPRGSPQQLQPRGSQLTPRGTVIKQAPHHFGGDGRRGYDETDSVPSKQMGGVCFPPVEPYGHPGFCKSASDSVLSGKMMDYGNEGLERIAPFECQMPPNDFTTRDDSRQIKTEDYGIDIFQKDEKIEDIVDEMKEEEKSFKIVQEDLVENKVENMEDSEMGADDQNKQNLDIKEQSENEISVKSQFQDFSAQTESDDVMHIVDRTSKALQFYAATGNIKQLLFVQRHLLSISDDSGDLPLHTAIINNQLEVIHNLLDVMSTLPYCRYKSSAYNSLRQTPLHLAVLMGQPSVVDRLLNVGADPTMVDRKGNSPAHLAILYGADSCLAILVRYQRCNVAKNKPFPELDLKNFDGFSTAHLAAITQNCNAMKLISKGKGNINMPDGKSGRTPLHHAVERDDLTTVGYLILEARANVNACCFDGNTPLHVACARQNVGIVALLIAAGGDPEMENDEVKEELYDEFEGVQDDKQMGDNSSNTSAHLDCYKPEDFAMDNEKVLRVLRGEPYSNVKELDQTDRDYIHTTDYFSSLSIQDIQLANHGTSDPSQEGDLHKLMYPVRVQISKMLDPPCEGGDWIALANALGLFELMDSQSPGYSQTRVLLNFYEEYGGTISYLMECLTSMGRMDVVSLISQYHSSSSLKKSNTNMNCYDSGLSSGDVKPLQTLTAAT
uniref:Nuclear Factor kappa B-a n=2 Tax=Mytilus galloprovincialis TaxID=29158 RepID=W5XLL5_MYTGA|nr:nuclear Factor kappa B-a [Mytilus galloprovincialis]